MMLGRKAEICVVDNRVFLLGLDHFYRNAMKRFEAGELLECAREVARVLEVDPADDPIEGYYHESDSLTEYFRLMRTLQEVNRRRESEVLDLPALQRLLEVASSPIYGRPKKKCLLPKGRDPLTHALERVPKDDWGVERLVKEARDTTLAWDDYSLVGLAAWADDPVVVTALRESVILYAMRYMTAALPRRRKKKFEWAVDDELVQRANRFIRAFNAICPFQIAQVPPPPVPASIAESFFKAGRAVEIIGRCACIAIDRVVKPQRYYHWAIRRNLEGEVVVEEFWSETLATTQSYRAKVASGPVMSE